VNEQDQGRERRRRSDRGDGGPAPARASLNRGRIIVCRTSTKQARNHAKFEKQNMKSFLVGRDEKPGRAGLHKAALSAGPAAQSNQDIAGILPFHVARISGIASRACWVLALKKWKPIQAEFPTGLVRPGMPGQFCRSVRTRGCLFSPPEDTLRRQVSMDEMAPRGCGEKGQSMRTPAFAGGKRGSGRPKLFQGLSSDEAAFFLG